MDSLFFICKIGNPTDVCLDYYKMLFENDKNGIEHHIDVNNPREDKKYTVVADSFIMNWGAEYDILAPKEECTEYPFNKAHLTSEYIKKLNAPITINQTGRIKFTD